MSASKIPVPPEFQSEVRYIESKDPRSDTEILTSLTNHTPITSEKNVWTYWHSGVHSMPKWTQRNICNWVRLLGPSWTVRVLDKVPGSANHALSWISPDQLPDCFVNDTMTGPYVGPHSADFLRGAALFKYGGVWMDVGNMLFRHLDKICWDKLEDEGMPYRICVPWMFAQHIGNHFVAARKGDEFIGKWHELFCHFWKDRTDYTGIITSPLISFVRNFKFSESIARGFAWEFIVDELTVMGYIGQVVAWIRCAWLQEPRPNGFNGVDSYCTKVLLYDVSNEDWRAEKEIGYVGQDLFDVLMTRRDKDRESEEFKKAYSVVWTLLCKASMQKFTHGKNLTKTTACGVFLDEAVGDEKEGEEGTFLELLRYGSVHFDQTRESVDYVEPIRPDEDVIIHKGLLEA